MNHVTDQGPAGRILDRVMVHVAPVVAVVALMLLAALVFPALANPLALAYGAAVTLAVTLVRDRRMAFGLAAVAILALALILWANAQPGYIGLGQ
jgi:hypothetical protein